MSLRNHTIAIVAIVVGIILICVGIAAFYLLNPLIASIVGSGLIVLGALILIGGIVIRYLVRDVKGVKAVPTSEETKAEEGVFGPEKFVPEVLLPKPGRKQLPVSTIEGIGEIYSKQLEKGGIQFVEDLALTTPETVGRLTDVKFGIAQKWIAMARLTWLDDVSNEDAECIVLGANITSIEGLAVANPDKLYSKVSTAEKFGRVQVPEGYTITKDKVKKWIESAKKELPESM
ncbi:MAG: DUF4332 domain-containing protein [Promethearchaeota archaeon]